jgi:tRNA A-37 threonylcarbamoyl transferase component Bud32
MERPMPEKPPRSKAPAGQYHGKRVGESNNPEWDQYPLATATTASATSATISYSTDQGDASDASEAGMEVIMGKNDSEEEGMLTVSKKHREKYVPHTFSAGKNTFTVDARYSLIRVIGSGAYGVVISAKDQVRNLDVAIKMVPKAFSDEIDAKRILREIKLLNHLKHDNIVRLIDMMPPNVKCLDDFIDVYLVTDLMETDLHKIIYSKQKLSIDHVQYFVYQVLRGLKYIHSCGILHRDLKPSNRELFSSNNTMLGLVYTFLTHFSSVQCS